MLKLLLIYYFELSRDMFHLFLLFINHLLGVIKLNLSYMFLKNDLMIKCQVFWEFHWDQNGVERKVCQLAVLEILKIINNF